MFWTPRAASLSLQSGCWPGLSPSNSESPITTFYAFIGGAVLGEALHIDVQMDADDLCLAYAGPPLQAQQIRYLMASAFASESSYCARKLQYFAWGLQGAWQAGFHHADVLSPLGAFRFVPGRAEPDPLDVPLPEVNQLRLKRKLGMAVIRRFLGGRAAEREVFEHGLGWSGIATRFNGQLMPGLRAQQGEFLVQYGLPSSMALYYRGNPIRLDFSRFLPAPFGFPAELEYSVVFDIRPGDLGHFRLIVADVEAGGFWLESCPGMLATVAVSTQQLDASMVRAVPNEQLDQLREVLYCAWLAAILRLVEMPSRRSECRKLISLALKRRSSTSALEEVLQRALWETPLVTDVQGRKHSLASLGEHPFRLDTGSRVQNLDAPVVLRRYLPLLEAADLHPQRPNAPPLLSALANHSQTSRRGSPEARSPGAHPRTQVVRVRFDGLMKQGAEITLPRPEAESMRFVLPEHRLQIDEQSRSILHLTRCKLEQHELTLVLTLFWKSDELRLVQSNQDPACLKEALRRVQVLLKYLPGHRRAI